MASPDRPLSPHLGIYRWQISNTLSILHRMAGFALAIGLIPLALWLWGAAYDESMFHCLHQFFASPIGLALLVGWTVAFYYHFANGLRHLNWDIGYGFKICSMTATGWAVLLFTVVMSASTWCWVGKLTGWF